VKKATKTPNTIEKDDVIDGKTVVAVHSNEKRAHVLFGDMTWADYAATGNAVELDTPEWFDFTDTIFHQLHDLFLPTYDLPLGFLQPLWMEAAKTVGSLHMNDEPPLTPNKLRAETFDRIVNSLRAFSEALTEPA
jgi:hypothetical protein